jgi:predicted RNA binding protein YcfA (HicA-like mRNA interferase family)
LPKYRIFSGKELCALLAEHGFLRVRQKGSHVLMQLKTADTTVTVPVPDHREIKIGTLQSIIRQSQLPRCLFEV